MHPIILIYKRILFYFLVETYIILKNFLMQI
jgi:hypothetical protein